MEEDASTPEFNERFIFPNKAHRSHISVEEIGSFSLNSSEMIINELREQSIFNAIIEEMESDTEMQSRKTSRGVSIVSLSEGSRFSRQVSEDLLRDSSDDDILKNKSRKVSDSDETDEEIRKLLDRVKTQRNALTDILEKQQNLNELGEQPEENDVENPINAELEENELVKKHLIEKSQSAVDEAQQIRLDEVESSAQKSVELEINEKIIVDQEKSKKLEETDLENIAKISNDLEIHEKTQVEQDCPKKALEIEIVKSQLESAEESSNDKQEKIEQSNGFQEPLVTDDIKNPLSAEISSSLEEPGTLHLLLYNLILSYLTRLNYHSKTKYRNEPIKTQHTIHIYTDTLIHCKKPM